VLLGAAKFSGEDGAPDKQRAVALFKQGEAKEPTGCINLGQLYREGVPSDAPKALELFEQACGMENGNGCLYVGGLRGGQGRARR
jgi:TPR repeat protein